MSLIDSKTFLYQSFRMANKALASDASAVKDSDSPLSTPETGLRGLGIEYTTPTAFVSSQWDLWGDGRRFVDDIERIMILLSLMESRDLDRSVGTAMQIADFVKRGFWVLSHTGEKACRALSDTDKIIVLMVAEYSEILKRHGLVELTEALDIMRPAIDFSSIYIDGSCVMDEPLSSFFEECGISRDGSAIIGNACDSAPSELAIYRAEGTSVIEKAIFDECKAAISCDTGRSIAVIAKDPFGAFDSLKSQLCEIGLKCTLVGSVPFQSTGFGRFFLSVCKLLAVSGEYGLNEFLEVDACDWVSIATDIAMNPYSSIAKFDAGVLTSSIIADRPNLSAKDLNSVWRGNRTLSVEDAVRDLRAVSPSFAGVERVFSNEGDPFATIRSFTRIANKAFAPQNAGKEMSAISAMLSLMEKCAEFEVPVYSLPLIAQYIATLDDESFVDETAISQNNGNEMGEVVFLSAASARGLASNSFDVVVLSDVSDGFLNAEKQVDSMRSLAESLDIPVNESQIERARAVFKTSADAASKRFACIFPAHDKDSQENFSSFCFDEFVKEALGRDVVPSDLLSGTNGSSNLSVELDEVEFRAIGEEAVQEGLGKRYSGYGSFESYEKVERGRLVESSVIDSMSKSAAPDGTVLPVISPSAIESYLGCPYKWFIDHQVSPSSLDESLSAIERGNFAHELLRRFYCALKELYGTTAVKDVPAEEVSKTYWKIAEHLLREQEDLPPNSGRYAVATAVEEEEASKLLDSISESMLRLGSLPSGFDIAASEYQISPFSEDPLNVEYAGFILNGKVDRIDSSDASDSYYVLDYKGSLRGHDAGSSCFDMIRTEDGDPYFDPSMLPSHVQTIVYASALSKLGLFGNDCKGAFYASYASHPEDALLKGSFEVSDEGFAAISDPRSAVDPPFNEFLALVEAALKTRLQGIWNNDIAPKPTSADICRYCIHETCERRLA